MTSLSTGRVTAIKGRSLSAECRQVLAADFHLFTAQTTTVFSTSSLHLFTNLRATSIARYRFKLLLFGLYRLSPPQSDFELPDPQPPKRHFTWTTFPPSMCPRNKQLRTWNEGACPQKVPDLQQTETTIKPEFRLSFVKYEASLHPTTSNHQLQSAGLLLNHKPTIKEFAIPGG